MLIPRFPVNVCTPATNKYPTSYYHPTHAYTSHVTSLHSHFLTKSPQAFRISLISSASRQLNVPNISVWLSGLWRNGHDVVQLQGVFFCRTPNRLLRASMRNLAWWQSINIYQFCLKHCWVLCIIMTQPLTVQITLNIAMDSEVGTEGYSTTESSEGLTFG